MAADPDKQFGLLNSMAAKEAKEQRLRERIAKHNGVSVTDVPGGRAEAERIAALRERLGAQPDPNEGGTAPTNAELVYPPQNPYRVLLGVVAGLGLLAGLILLGVGASNYGSFDPEAGHTDSGLVQMFFGGAVLNLGVAALLVLFGAEMVLWRAHKRI